MHPVRRWLLATTLAVSRCVFAVESKPYRLPSVDLKQPIIWTATCESPDGFGLAFGGQDQRSESGASLTRVRDAGEWKSISAQLAESNPLRDSYYKALEAAAAQKKVLADDRTAFFEGHPISVASLKTEWDELIARQQAAENLSAEPAPRALSPIVYDAKNKLFVLFGGDHLDYLTNDLWVFDSAKSKWMRRNPAKAPPPRANHTLKAAGDGTIVLSGGYTYASNTDYMGGQYVDLNDGEWTYDLATDRWSRGGECVDSRSRVYRTGPLHPEYYQDGPAPDRPAFAKFLEQVPDNTWVQTRPARLPRLNRDWGSAILDPDRDLILRWSGGHCAHGGTDVLQYHCSTNRWELTAPVEFPLGQLYANTDYPQGVSFNRRAWITGHTYQNYGYEPTLRKMIFTGQPHFAFLYDPVLGDWSGRLPEKPAGMSYDGCFYTLTTCTTPHGLFVWTDPGQLFRFDSDSMTFIETKTTGEKLAHASVDNSTAVYDAKRDRLFLFRKNYGQDHPFDGKFQSVDLKTFEVTAVVPEGAAAATAISYLCQIRYDVANDLFLAGCTLPPDSTGFRRTPAYDPVQNRWISLHITGDDPSGKQGRNVSLGLMYDARRKLFWAVDTDSKVFVLRVNPNTAQASSLE